MRHRALFPLLLLAAGCLTVPSEPETEILFGCSVSRPEMPCSATPVLVALGATLDSLSASVSATCGLTAAGATYCWGDGRLGQTGDSTASINLTPVRVRGAQSFVEVRLGGGSACGREAAGAVWCWGDGWLGTQSRTNSPVPVAVDGGLSFSSIAAGYRHYCGILADASTVCWGMNYFGALGTGTVTDSRVPVAVNTALTFQQVTAGTDFTCGLTAAGATYCWGNNLSGVLGDYSTGCNFAPSPCAMTPQRVATAWSFVSIVASASAVCGRTAAGVVACWGEGGQGQLGDSTFWRSPVPVAVKGLPPAPIVNIAAGGFHFCALTGTGELYCWGANFLGELGTGSTAGGVAVAARAGGDRSYSAVAAGDEHTCAITTGGATYCWGAADRGRLGGG